MMMCSFGTGVGHHQHPDFPWEDSKLRQVPIGKFYIDIQEQESSGATDRPHLDTDDELEGDFEDIDGSQAGDEFEEDIYKL